MMMGQVVRSYGDLDERARRLASVLGGLGAGPGRPVATVLPNGIEMFEVATAAAMVNAPYLPVNWHLRSDELAYILDDADVAVVVGQTGYDDDLTKALESHKAGSLRVGDDYERELESAMSLPEWDSGAGPELMFYTSGTTARPKGVVHASLSDDSGRVRGMEGQVALWSWTADDVYVMSGPAYHASHLGWALCSLVHRGGHGASPSSSRPVRCWRRSADAGAPARSWCPPTSSASSRSPRTSGRPWTCPASR